MNRLSVISHHVSPNAALGAVECGAPAMPKGLLDALAAVRARKQFQPRAWINDKAKKLVRLHVDPFVWLPC